MERREAGRVLRRNAGPRRKRGQIIDLTRRPRRSHPLGETEKRTMGGPEPAFSGRRSVGCAGYLTRESETPSPVRGGSAAQRRHPPPCGEGRERSERGGGRSGSAACIQRGLDTRPHPDRLRFASAIDPSQGEGDAATYCDGLTAASSSRPSGTCRLRARTGGLRGSPTPPATGRAACRRPRRPSAARSGRRRCRP